MSTQAVKLTPEEKKLQAQEKHKANEILHKVIVKIISWKAGPLEGASVHISNKITPEEWQTYKQHILNIYKAEGVDKAKLKIEEAEKAIKANGGFAK